MGRKRKDVQCDKRSIKEEAGIGRSLDIRKGKQFDGHHLNGSVYVIRFSKIISL
jgi:hypothetical protein